MFLAIDLWQLPVRLGQIFYTIVLPVLLLAAVGYLIQRCGGLDMNTLRRLNFQFVIPAIIYYSILTSELSVTEVGTVVGFSLLLLTFTAAVAWIIGRMRGCASDLRRAMMMTVGFQNSGNFGIPLQKMAFSSYGPEAANAAVGYQAFVMITQNLISFTVGIGVVSGGQRARRLRETLAHVAKLPPLYAIAAAVVTIQIRNMIGPDASAAAAEIFAPAWNALVWAKNAFIATALVTLGAQLATIRSQKVEGPVMLSVALRLLVGPVVAVAVVYLLRASGIQISPFLAQVLLINAAAPTAVNVMLLCLEFGNHPDYAARTVLASMVLSPITVTLVVFLAQSGILPGF